MKNKTKAIREFPQYLTKGLSKFKLTKYYSYVDIKLYGITQQKNACSYQELIAAGYKASEK